MDSKMQWFKFYGGDWLTDLKIITMEPMDKLVFVYLMCLVSVQEIPGVVTRCTEQTLLKMFQLGDQASAFGCLTRLEKLGMIKVTDSNEDGFLEVEVVNFRKRQERALTTSERQQLYRERKRVDSNEDVTESNASVTHVTKRNETVTLEKRRIEKNREDNTATDVAKPFVLEEKLQQMETKEGSYLDIIATFIRGKGVKIENGKQLSAVIARYARPAKAIEGAYTNEQLWGAVRKLKRQQDKDGLDWTLETMIKLLTK